MDDKCISAASSHESGYFEDCSDVEDHRRRTAQLQSGGSSGYSSCSRSTGLAKAINELDVRDSPASPDPIDPDDEDRILDNTGCAEGKHPISCSV